MGRACFCSNEPLLLEVEDIRDCNKAVSPSRFPLMTPSPQYLGPRTLAMPTLSVQGVMPWPSITMVDPVDVQAWESCGSSYGLQANVQNVQTFEAALALQPQRTLDVPVL